MHISRNAFLETLGKWCIDLCREGIRNVPGKIHKGGGGGGGMAGRFLIWVDLLCSMWMEMGLFEMGRPLRKNGDSSRSPVGSERDWCSLVALQRDKGPPKWMNRASPESEGVGRSQYLKKWGRKLTCRITWWVNCSLHLHCGPTFYSARNTRTVCHTLHGRPAGTPPVWIPVFFLSSSVT